MTRFKQYSDGRKAIQRLTGRRWGRPMVVFGERILVKVAVARAARRAGLESAFIPAVYVGHHGRSGALMALTEHGAVKARSFKKVPESDRFVASELENLKGLPWNLLGSFGVAIGRWAGCPGNSNSACTYRYAAASTKDAG